MLGRDETFQELCDENVTGRGSQRSNHTLERLATGSSSSLFAQEKALNEAENDIAVGDIKFAV